MKRRAPRLAPLSADMNVLYVTPDLGEGDILRREFSARDPDLRFESTATPHEAIERLEAGTQTVTVAPGGVTDVTVDMREP